MRNKGNNPFPYSDSNKRYRTYDYYLRERFHKKVSRISLDAGFTCPNLDGKKGVGGCTYCSSRGSGDFAASSLLPIKEQFEEVKARMANKWSDTLYIPYFQAHTNTYAPTERLRELYYTALDLENVVGLSIATRADCLSSRTVELLHEISEKTYLTVELGLQSIHDCTAEKINRCHSYEDFLKGYEKLRTLNVCVHLINGLPGEDSQMMLESAKEIARLKPHMVKLHLLHIISGTVMAEQFEAGKFGAMTLEEYVNVVCNQLEVLPSETVIGRITGDGAKETLVAPLWSLKKFVVMNEIDKELAKRGTFQGYSYCKDF